jgi:CheY-like chemotaxis protein/DNA-binding XRE family transcriptional regulator
MEFGTQFRLGRGTVHFAIFVIEALTQRREAMYFQHGSLIGSYGGLLQSGGLVHSKIMIGTDVRKPFGASVRVWRGRLGLSQEKLAARAGLHRTYLSDVERGARNISLLIIQRLASALEVPASSLLAFPCEAGETAPAADLLPADDLAEILLVEDQEREVEQALRALKQANIANPIHVAHDGAAALDYLFRPGQHACHQRRQPQLILLDLGLPKMDGLEVLRPIKADSRTRSIPVVLLAASNLDKRLPAGKRLGAVAHITKPVRFQNLLQVTPRLSLKWGFLRAKEPSFP